MNQNTGPFKEALEKELALVERELGELGVRNRITGEWDATPEAIDPTATEPDEIADRIESEEERSGEVAALQTQYRNITRALGKISSGTFGTCEICGEAIETERLQANPSARTCTTHINDEVGLPE